MIGLALAAFVAASPLDEAQSAFQSGDLARAQSELVGLLYPLRLDSDELERDARLLLAATYYAQEDAARAEEEAVLALGVFGSATLDPLVFPPDFVGFLEGVRARQATRIAGLAAERREKRAPPVRLAPEPPPPSVAWQFVPFGAGQFKNGERTKGKVLAVSQGVCLAVATASLVAALSLRGPDGKYSHADAEVARPLNVAYLAGAYSCAALYGYGVVDGLVARAAR